MKKLAKSKYNELIGKISELVNQSRIDVVKTINAKIVQTYWTVGRYIVEYEQKGKERADYGSELMKTISKELSAKLGKGFSQRNLRDMRRMYLIYPKWQTLSAKLSWSHYCLLLSIEDSAKRRFYEKETVKNSYSFRELKRQIDSALFERLALSKDKKGVLELSQRGLIIEKPQDVVKDPYVLEFLGIPESEKISEAKLESALIRHLRNFLLELGRGFSFVDRQHRITMNNIHYYVDLVFYHIELKCYVLMDLKVREFRHEDAGQMNFYLNYFKNEINVEGDNPPIGIILCLEKDRVYVDYVLGGLSPFNSLSINSLVVNTFTNDCCLRCGSLDQISALIDNASARYGMSFGSSGKELAAFIRKDSYSEDLKNLINFSTSDNLISNSCSDNFDFDRQSSLYLLNSDLTYSVVENSVLSDKNKYDAAEFGFIIENKTLLSTTSSILIYFENSSLFSGVNLFSNSSLLSGESSESSLLNEPFFAFLPNSTDHLVNSFSSLESSFLRNASSSAFLRVFTFNSSIIECSSLSTFFNFSMINESFVIDSGIYASPIHNRESRYLNVVENGIRNLYSQTKILIQLLSAPNTKKHIMFFVSLWDKQKIYLFVQKLVSFAIYKRGILKLNLSYRTSNDSTTFSDWKIADNSTSSTIGEQSRYLEYRAEFNTTAAAYTPVLHNVSIVVDSTCPCPSSGDWNIRDVCTLDTTCSLDGSDVYITSDNNLTISDGGLRNFGNVLVYGNLFCRASVCFG